jgi:hypothetical protein
MSTGEHDCRFLSGGLARELIILAGFVLATLVLTYPLSVNAVAMVPGLDDPLLSAWRLHWVGHTLLTGTDALSRLFDANIFYPYPLTLAYSEHFLGETFLSLPLLWITDSHLVGLNLSAMLSFVLTAYATYLFIADWSHSRLAGLIAGFLFTFSPFRFGHILQLELLVTQWMPLTLLALRWLVCRQDATAPSHRRRLALGLCILFLNLQALSSFYYTVYLLLACAALLVVCAVTGQVHWRWGLPRDLIILAVITAGVNMPIWSKYLEFSQLMGAIRAPGEVRVYSAALTDYLTTIPHNLLYGWTFGRWQAPDHQFQPLAPTGIVGLLLGIGGLITLLRRASRQIDRRALGLCLAVTALIGFVLSLGTNEAALGSALAPWLSYVLPYRWLYEYAPGFTGMRVPARAAVLVALGLAGLAGAGGAWLARRLLKRPSLSSRERLMRGTLLGLLALVGVVEYWSVPLSGPELPAGGTPPEVYTWLRHTAADTVVLELPQHGHANFAYEYYSTYHWRRLVNGATGYTPPAHREMRNWFKTFPDWRSVDALQQLGVDYVVLHAERFDPKSWEHLQAQLSWFLPAFDALYDVGTSRVLRVAEPLCRPDYQDMAAELSVSAQGRNATAVVTVHNYSVASFVADVTRPSQLALNGQPIASFLEPLVVPPNERRSVTVPLRGGASPGGRWEAHLATLGRTVVADSPALMTTLSATMPSMIPLELQFLGGARLRGYSVAPDPLRLCGHLVITLHWEGGVIADVAEVGLLDRFGRVGMDSTSQPWCCDETAEVDVHRMPLPGTLPAGAYSLRVRLLASDGTERPIVTTQGRAVEVAQLPGLPVVIHPQPPVLASPTVPLAHFANAITLVAAELPEISLHPGEWLRFALFWRAESPLEQDVTVFTQLIGPDGRVWGQHDNPPRGGWYPVSLWRPGEVVRDDYALRLDPAAPPGRYQLVIGLYDSQTLQRLNVERPEGIKADHVIVHTYEVGAAR